MGNPFYIPQQQEPKRDHLAAILAALKLGTDIYGTWQQGDIAEKKLEATTAAAAQQQAWEQQKHAETLASHALDREQRAATANASLPYHQQSYGFGDHMKLALKAKDLGDDANILNFSKQLTADKTITKMDAWKMFRENDQLRESAIESLTKKVQSASEKGAKEGVNYLETKEGQADYQRLQALSDPEAWKQIVDANFSETASSYQQAQAKAKKDASFAPVNVEGVGLVDPNNREVLVQSKPKPTEASLYRDAAAGVPTAQAALQAMQSGKIKVARESRPPSEAGKPKRVPYRDTQTGAINYYDVNNPQDRATLQKFGTQLAPILENPEDVLIRQALSKKAPQAQPAAATYKTPEEVKAAMERKEITPEAATDILKKKFGFQ